MMKTMISMFFLGCMLVLAGVFSDARPAFAQECPRAPGVAELPPPSVTAAQVESGAGYQQQFQFFLEPA